MPGSVRERADGLNGLQALPGVTNVALCNELPLTPTLDPSTLAVVAVVLTAGALVACVIPARRAARIDAIEALRCG